MMSLVFGDQIVQVSNPDPSASPGLAGAGVPAVDLATGTPGRR